MAQPSRFDPGYVVAALLPLIGLLPTLGNGVLHSADGPLHVQRIYALALMLAQGDVWPRWIPYFHLGYGYPIFNFYPPGVFHLGALFVLLGFSAASAFNLVAAAAWAVGSAGAYALSRHFLPGHAAIVSAMIWAYAPSRLFEVWNQGSLPQMMASALIPWLFWAMIRLADQPNARRAALVAFPLAGIILTHQPMAFITVLFAALGAGALALWFARKNWRTLPRRLLINYASLGLGGLSAAIFLLPVAAELPYVAAVTTPSDTLAYLTSNFLQIEEIFVQPQLHDLTDLRAELPATLGIVGPALALAGLAALAAQGRIALTFGLAAGLTLATFMLLDISLPVWSAIPYFAQLRFPERFLRAAVIFVATAGGASILLWPRRWQAWGTGITIIVVLAAALPTIYPNRPFKNWDNLSAVDLIKMELDEHVWGTTSYNEFNPQWGRRIAFDAPRDLETYASDPLRLRPYHTDLGTIWPEGSILPGDDGSFIVSTAKTQALRLRQYYFPGWTASLDGQPAEIHVDDEFGLMAIQVPPGKHIIHFNYTGTTIQTAAAIITLAATATALLLVFQPLRGLRLTTALPRPIDTERLPLFPALALAGAVIGLALFNAAYVIPHTMWFRVASPPSRPAYMEHPVNASFGDEFELLGYTLTQTETRPGGRLKLILYWHALNPVDHPHQPVVQLVNLPVTESWGRAQPFFRDGPGSPFPTNRFLSSVAEIQLVSDAPPYPGRIMIQMIDSVSGQPLRLADGTDRLLLEPLIRVQGSGPAVQQQFAIKIGEKIELWCASVRRDTEQFAITLYWHANGPLEKDYQIFVHGLDENGEIVRQNDGPPLKGAYPTSLWATGQTLADSYVLPYDARIEAVAVGLYLPADNTRLPVVTAGEAEPQQRILLPLLEANCTR